MEPFTKAIMTLNKMVKEQEEKIEQVVNRAKYEARYLTGFERNECMRKVLWIDFKHPSYGECRLKIPHYTNPKNHVSYSGVCVDMSPACELIFHDHRFSLTWKTLLDMDEDVESDEPWKKCQFIGPEQAKRSWVLVEIPCSIKIINS